MCGGTDPNNIYDWLCDDCLASINDGTFLEPCEECKSKIIERKLGSWTIE